MPTTVSHDVLHRFCTSAMAKAGVDPASAQTTAEILVTSDTWGTHTHGTKQLRGLMRNFRQGRMDVAARPVVVGEGPSWASIDDVAQGNPPTGLGVVGEGPSWASIDGCHSLPMPSSVLAMRTAIAKARQTGIAMATVRNSGHYGAAGYYAWLAADQDMIGLSFSNVDPGVAAPGSRGPVLGTNPLAYAVPSGEEKPVMLDIATSVAAASKVYAMRDREQSIPEGWIIDGEGRPASTVPVGFPSIGALMPMAGHKGYGLGFLVEVLTGVLASGAVGNEVRSWVIGPDQPVNQSHTFIAIDVGLFEPTEDFKRRQDGLIRQIRSAPKAVGSDRIYVPGEKEWEYHAKVLANGLDLPTDVRASLAGLAQDLGLAKPDWL